MAPKVAFLTFHRVPRVLVRPHGQARVEALAGRQEVGHK